MADTETSLSLADLAAQRPRTVAIAAALLMCNAALLAIVWIAFPSHVESNGAQLFFMILWLSVAISVFRGISWVRYGIIAVLVVFVVEVLNAGQPLSQVQAMNFGDQLSRCTAVAAIVLLFLPPSHSWFKKVKATYAES